jgi:hypothetical protein
MLTNETVERFRGFVHYSRSLEGDEQGEAAKGQAEPVLPPASG